MIDSNKTIMHKNEHNDCIEKMKNIIESMAYEIVQYRNPQSYGVSQENVKSIMREFGWNEM